MVAFADAGGLEESAEGNRGVALTEVGVGGGWKVMLLARVWESMPVSETLDLKGIAGMKGLKSYALGLSRRVVCGGGGLGL